jgi:hypothetical protein
MGIYQRMKQALSRGSSNASPHPRPLPNETDDTDYVPKAEDYPVWPPKSPSKILTDREAYWQMVNARKFAAPQGQFKDSPESAFYRLYEFFVLDKTIPYRNQLEFFWRRQEWIICEIPDPADPDPSRYAFLAGVTYLMVRSFNQRVSIGLNRGSKPLLIMEEAEALKNVPHEQRHYEQVPAWAERVPPLPDTLIIPTHDGTILDSKDDKRADPDFLKKNILIWTPHIYFT